MVAAFVKTCSSRVDCICVSCKGKKERLELNKFQKQNIQKTVPQVLQQLSTKEWKSSPQLSEELNIHPVIVNAAIKWLLQNEPKLLMDKQPLGKDGRLVRVFSLTK